MPMALQALPPLLMLPTETAPPLAEAVATPPLPAEATSVKLFAAAKEADRAGLALATSVVPRTPAASPNRGRVDAMIHALPPFPGGTPLFRVPVLRRGA